MCRLPHVLLVHELISLICSFVSDAIGQAPSIQDGTFTTKLPADVDEEQFGLSSTSLPLPLPRRAGGDPTEVGFAYFIQKCRFVLVLSTPYYDLSRIPQSCAACEKRKETICS